jgi:hypothetical protein
MQDVESTDLAGAAYLSAEQEAWEVEYLSRYYNDYDHDFEDDPDYRSLYMPDETDELLAILDRIAAIAPSYVPVSFLPNYDPADIPF